ncbi:hypothetical protein [Bradyrhizobium retamae]|uniref:hypothetical protein n=1 Tax=Bradyrhizobium retamae TaxID=1300035 RepID=UPI000B297199|nr:hypothetical protein [Bradyrhizobium retamae]
MPRLKGDLASAIIVNPHFVQLNVPDGGFGSELDAMVQFCLEHGEEFRIACFRQIDQRDCILFCFRDSKNAAEFSRRFGGEIYAIPSHDDLFFP